MKKKIIWFLLFLGLTINASFSQETLEDILKERNSYSKQFDKSGSNSSKKFVDNSIDESTYFIGMGDVFSISLPNLPNTQYKGYVNQNCDIVVSSVGVVKMGKQTLAQAKDSLKSYIRKKLIKVDSVYVSLEGGKDATITLTGNMLKLGSYIFPSTYRILDVLREGNNGSLPDLTLLNYRNVRCKNNDSIFQLDLYKYLFKADISQNPYIYPGDHIHLDATSRRVYIYGPITNIPSGEFPILEDESISDVLSFLSLDESAETSFVILQSGRDISKRKNEIIKKEMFGEYHLKDRDAITIPVKKDYPQYLAVNISGEVMRPGSFPVLNATTTISEILEMAGGITSRADFDRAVIIRQSKINPILDNKISVTPMIRQEELLGLKKMGMMNDFVILPLKHYPEKLTLRPNDRIIIPKIDEFIYISGNVERPGPYAFVENKKFKSYIRDAGGFTSKADRSNTMIVSCYEDAFQFKSGDDLQRGDIIVVPDIQEYKRFRSLFMPIVQTTAAILTAVIGILSLVR